MSKIVLEAQNIEKHFTDGKSTVEVIKGLSLQVKAGEFVSIVGRVVRVKVLCCMSWGG